MLLELDKQIGIKQSGNENTWLMAIKDFSSSIDDTITQIKKAVEKNDIKHIIVYVHGMKSVGLLIGATPLYAMGVILEEYGNQNQTSELLKEIPYFLTLLEKYKSIVKKYIPEINTTKKPLSKTEWEEALLAISQYNEAFDIDACVSVIEELENYKIPKKYKETYQKLTHAVGQIDRSTISKLCSEMGGQ